MDVPDPDSQRDASESPVRAEVFGAPHFARQIHEAQRLSPSFWFGR